ncbi:Molybdopterin-guanine dinucleotide biosynthesis protein MobA [uncultured Candidatus Thioglobus sp.]|nr:Molybdopterin-guanine dinucleotide biosynthesis protein MobA [uncultured Candidatus Thioglobus sp.]
MIIHIYAKVSLYHIALIYIIVNFMLIRQDITAVILSGGQSTRMQGKDKGLIMFNNKPLIKYSLEAVSDRVAHILISANRNLQQYREFGEVITDDLTDFQGPLAGISKALQQAKTSYLLVLPCDTPFINSTLINRLIETMSQNKVDICVADDGVKMHPSIAIIECSLKNNLLDFLATGERKLGLWIEKNNFIKVDFSDYPEALSNFNNAHDLYPIQK